MLGFRTARKLDWCVGSRTVTTILIHWISSSYSLCLLEIFPRVLLPYLL